MGGISISESVKFRFSKCRFSAELKKLKKYSKWGAASNNKSKKPWVCIFALSPCGNRCRFSESGFLFRRRTIENKIDQKIQTLRWRLAKVAFDTVQLFSEVVNITLRPFNKVTSLKSPEETLWEYNTKDQEHSEGSRDAF